MQSIWLVGINAKFAHTNPAIRYLKNYADNPAVGIAEYTINMPLESILSDLLNKGGRAYGFSVYIWNVDFCRRLGAALKREGAAVLFGGPEATYSPESFLEYGDVILGEGEKPFRAWTEAFLAGRETRRETPSLCFLEGGKKRTNPATPPVELQELEQPYFDLKELKNRVVYYESSRGCPFACSYCLSSIEKGVRFAPAEKVKQDLELFRRAGVMRVKFVDRTFNADKARAKEIFRDIAEKGGNTGFHFEIAADLLDDETAEILSRAKKGLIQLEIGVQSTHPPTLRAIRREQDFSHTRRMVRRIAEGGNVHQHLDLIAGLPLEGLGEFAKSFDDVMDVGAEKVQLGFLKVLHGSAMEAEAARYGIEYQKSAPYEVTRTDAIAPAELALLHEIEYLLDRAYNSGLFPQTVRWFSRQCGGYFAFFREWNDLAKEGKPPRNWTEGDLAASLLAFGERRNIPFGRDFLRWDALCRNFRPRLPEFLEQPGREAERRAFYRDFPEEWVPENRKGKRPWHYTRLEWFSADIPGYLREGKLQEKETIVLFDYAADIRRVLGQEPFQEKSETGKQ